MKPEQRGARRQRDRSRRSQHFQRRLQDRVAHQGGDDQEYQPEQHRSDSGLANPPAFALGNLGIW